MSSSGPRRPFKAALLLLVATVGWGVSFPTMKALELTQRPLVPEASSWFFTAVSVITRFGVAGIIVVLFCARWDPLESTCRHASLSIL